MTDTAEIPVPEAVCGYCRIRLTAIPDKPERWENLWYHPVCIQPAQTKARMRTEALRTVRPRTPVRGLAQMPLLDTSEVDMAGVLGCR